MKLRRKSVLGLGACALASAISRPSVAFGEETPPSVTITYQYGVAYAPLIIIKQQGLLEKQYPSTTFEWRVLANGSAIRDGMIANTIQLGAAGVAPFLIGWDRGVGWRLVGSLCNIDLWLVARDPKIKSLKDITPSMKIGMPAPDSLQAIVLRKGAQLELGNAHALDANIVAISHPLGLIALENGQLAAHFSNPPFQFEEVAHGGHVILRSFDVFGPSTLDSVFATEAFAQQYPTFLKKFYGDLESAIDLLHHDLPAAAEFLSRETGGKTSAQTYLEWLKKPDTVFTTIPSGFLKYAKFMHDIGLIKKVPSSIGDVELPTIAGQGN